MFLLASSGEWLEYLNYPGLEAWKFINLTIFAGGAIFILRKKINEALIARGLVIKQEIAAAQTEREQALAKLADAHNRLEGVSDAVRMVHDQAQQEAELERRRLADSTTVEMDKLKQQAQREMETADKLARKELRHFLAQRSVELARESVLSQMRPEDDTALIQENIGDLRRTTV